MAVVGSIGIQDVHTRHDRLCLHNAIQDETGRQAEEEAEKEEEEMMKK